MGRPARSYDEADVKKVALALSDVPQKAKKLTAKEVALALKPQINDLRNKGYEWREIANILEKQGIKVAIKSLSGGTRIQRKPRPKPNEKEADNALQSSKASSS